MGTLWLPVIHLINHSVGQVIKMLLVDASSPVQVEVPTNAQLVSSALQIQDVALTISVHLHRRSVDYVLIQVHKARGIGSRWSTKGKL